MSIIVLLVYIFLYISVILHDIPTDIFYYPRQIVIIGITQS